MKKVIIMVLLVVISVSAQYKMTSISATIGKGALSSGYDISLGFSNGDNTFQVTGNHTRVFGTFSWDLSPFTVSASGGFFQNAPWAGPLVVFKPTEYISTMHWYGMSAGVPDKPGWDVHVLVRYNALSLHVWKFTATFAVSKFLDNEIDYLPGIKFSDMINESWKISVSVDYTVTGATPLFQFGMHHSI